ncbi:MAG: glycosyltransferase [Candidatus Omnitrophota bacterium]|jgi:processive 1,2-diacylglycerol beta-glucosyltransferase
MKIFIIYASAGAGHTKAAEAVYDYFKAINCSDTVRLIDVLDSSSLIYKFAYKSGYSFLIRYPVWLWAAAFWLTDFRPLRFLSCWLVAISNSLNTKSFRRFLVEENPDYIISTHFLPSEIAAKLKSEKRITSKLITVITDFGVHPFWINKETDLYLVASAATKQDLLSEGVPENRIKESGIPVKERFLKKHDKRALCSKLGIDADKFTVLIMTGSFGIGPIKEIVQALYQDTQLLVVCALNKQLYEDLSRKNFPNVKVYAFVDNSDELMAVSDLIITKPGGLSISEILNIGLIPIFISSIPGQEKKNVSVLSKLGIGSLPKNTKEIRDVVLGLKANPGRFNALKEKIRVLSKPDCLKDIADVVCESSTGPAA